MFNSGALLAEKKMTPSQLLLHWKDGFMSRFREAADPDYAFMQSALGPAPPAPPDFDIPTIFLSMEGVLLCKEWDVRAPHPLHHPSDCLR